MVTWSLQRSCDYIRPKLLKPRYRVSNFAMSIFSGIGLTELSRIVAVHPLNGHAGTSFSTDYDPASRQSPEINWLRDILPKALEEVGISVRVMTFGYNTGEWLKGVDADTPSNELLSRLQRALVGPILLYEKCSQTLRESTLIDYSIQRRRSYSLGMALVHTLQRM